MKKVILSFLLVFSASVVFAAPFIVLEKYESSLFDKLIAKRPVQVYISVSLGAGEEETVVSSDLIHYTQTAFSAWFENVLSRLTAQQQQSLEPYLPIIEYAAVAGHYQYTKDPSRADIKIHYTDVDQVAKKCSGGAGGCYRLQSKTIWIVYPEKLTPPYGPRRTIIHEIGHAFTMDDLYTLRYLKNKKIGSGLQESIMNRSTELTCDDADAIVIALQRAMGKEQTSSQMTSFCNAERKFKDGRMASQEMYHESKGGVLVVYANCLGQPIKPQLEVSLKDPEKIYKIIGEKKCIAPFLPKQAEYQQITPEFLSQNAYLSHIDLSSEKVYHRPLLLGTSGLDVFVHVKDLEPYLFYILDKKGEVAYLSASLNNGYTWVYEYPFSSMPLGEKQCMSRRCSGPSQMFVYKDNDPWQYSVFMSEYDEPAEQDLCYQNPAQCQPLQKMLEEAFFNMKKSTGLNLVFPEGGWMSDPAQSIKQTQNWNKEMASHFAGILRENQIRQIKKSFKQQFN